MIMRSFALATAFTFLAIGFIVMAMTYSNSGISGPRCNPAVMVVVMLRTFLGTAHLTFDVKQALVYIPAQGLGAMLGTFAASGAFARRGSLSYPPLSPVVSISRGSLGECGAISTLLYLFLYVTTFNGLVGTSFLGPAAAVIITTML